MTKKARCQQGEFTFAIRVLQNRLRKLLAGKRGTPEVDTRTASLTLAIETLSDNNLPPQPERIIDPPMWRVD